MHGTELRKLSVSWIQLHSQSLRVTHVIAYAVRRSTTGYTLPRRKRAPLTRSFKRHVIPNKLKSTAKFRLTIRYR